MDWSEVFEISVRRCFGKRADLDFAFGTAGDFVRTCGSDGELCNISVYHSLGGKADILSIACILLAAAGMTFCANPHCSLVLYLKMGVHAKGALFSKLLRVKTAFFTKRESGELADGMVGFSNAAVSMGAAVFISGINLILSVVYMVQMSSFIRGIILLVIGIAVILLIMLTLQIHRV